MNNQPTTALGAYFAAPSEFDEAPTEELTGFTFPTRDELTAMTDELATLRADNDARGVLIEQLRAERDQLRAGLIADSRRNEALAAELGTVRSERDIARSESIALSSEAHRELRKLDNVRNDRDKYFAAYQRTLRALNAALGEP